MNLTIRTKIEVEIKPMGQYWTANIYNIIFKGTKNERTTMLEAFYAATPNEAKERALEYLNGCEEVDTIEDGQELPEYIEWKNYFDSL